MQGDAIPVDVIVYEFPAWVRRKVGEGRRRKLYELLRFNAIQSPIGWILVTPNDEIYRLIDEINSVAGTKVVKVYRVYVPRGTLKEWIRDYMNVLRGVEASYAGSETGVSRQRRVEALEARRRLARLLVEL